MKRPPATPKAALDTVRQVFQSTKLSPAAKVDTLLPLLGLHTGKAHDRAIHSNLKPIFEQAHLDHLDLLHPPVHFHQWLDTVLHLNHKDPSAPVRPNTVLARLTTLSRLYARLIQLGLLPSNPVSDYPRPEAQRDTRPLPSPQTIHALLLQVKAQHPAMHAAMHLIYHHAYHVQELLTLTWADLDLERHAALRDQDELALHPQTVRALQALPNAPKPLLQAKRTPKHVFPYTTLAFQQTYWQAFRDTGLPFIPSAKLRLAGLRDHPPAPATSRTEQARTRGFRDPHAYQETLRLARTVGIQDSSREGQGQQARRQTRPKETEHGSS